MYQKLLKSIFILIGLFSLLVLSGFGTVYYLKSWSEASHGMTAEVELELEKGISLSKLSTNLQDAGIISSATLFKYWTKLFSRFSEFKAGPYKIALPIAPQDLAKKFIEGSVFHELKYEILIPEGFTLKSVVERFASAGIGNRSVYYLLSTDRQFLDTLGIAANSIEGYLYPATYYFYQVPTEADVLREMVNTFWKKMPQGLEAMAASRGITLYQALIMASLIEAETMYDEERPMISEVLWNRLKKDMSLGIDAAVIYGISNFNGDLTSKNLSDESNPYNLRIHKGLPPTPINSPTSSSIKAVFNPTENGYFYYVLSSENNGRHTFSKTLDEHNSAVSRYLKKN